MLLFAEVIYFHSGITEKKTTEEHMNVYGILKKMTIQDKKPPATLHQGSLKINGSC